MKKTFFYLLTFAYCVIILSSCSGETQKGGSILVSANLYANQSLNITYSKSIVLGKSVSLDVYTHENVVNISIIGAIIPNVKYINLGTVAYEGTPDKFTFKAQKLVEDNMMFFSGSLQNGVCTIDLEYKLENQSLTKMWYLAFNEESVPKEFVFNIDWESKLNKISSLDMELDVFCDELLTPLVSGLIIEQGLLGFDFKEDGNIIIKATDDVLMSIPPLNIAIYNIISENQLKLLINPLMLMEMPLSKSVSFQDILDMIETGINLKYTLEGDKLDISFVFSKSAINILAILLPEIELLVPSDDPLVGIIKPVIKDLTNVMLQTTRFDIRLKLDAIDNISKPEPEPEPEV